MIKKIITVFQTRPIGLILLLVIQRILHKKISEFKLLVDGVKNRTGLEIGGPSTVFKKDRLVPLYELAAQIDGCNFADSTVWEGKLQEGMHYRYITGKTGKQILCDAVSLHKIPDHCYDFVISTNCLEHIANPIAALKNWLRVLKSQGMLLVMVPIPQYTFDHYRPITKIEHLIEDYTNNTSEQDMSHLEEILSLHDLKRDPQAGTKEEFRMRCKNNHSNRCIHHHIFNLSLLQELFRYLNISIILSKKAGPDWLIAGRKN